MEKNLQIAMLVLLTSTGLGFVASAAEETWYPSQYGADDTIGAANNLSPIIVRAAAGLVTEGKVYSLGIETGPRTPRLPPRDYRVLISPSSPTGKAMAGNQITGHDDMVMAWQGIGTQIDGLGHVGINFHHYNGVHADDIYAADGLRKFSIHNVPPIVTRGVMLDMAGFYGVDVIEPGTAFNKAELDGAAARQGIEIRKGDVVLLHTGWLSHMYSDTERFLSVEPGLGKAGARYLAALGVVAVGADTQGLDVVPAEVEGEFAPVHQILLAQNGVYILEYIDTRELAADGVWEFLFVLSQPRLVGAVQAIVNPIAIR